jgi:polyisoprenoid-binding protein YceI
MNRLRHGLVVSALAGGIALAPSASQAADVWQIDPAHSAAMFAVTHMMVSTVRGEFGKMTGTLDYDGKDVASLKVDATIDATTVSTRNEYRDNDLKSEKWFDVAKYPTLTFKSKKVVPGSGGAFQLVGDLTMHGVTKEVTLDVAAPSKVVKGMKGESRVGATGTVKLSRKDFGMAWTAPVAGGGEVVSDQVAVTIDIEAMLPPAGGPPPPPPPKK